MFQSYLLTNKYNKINLLMDQFCQECEKAGINNCTYCSLYHRKGNNSPAYGARADTEQERLNSWMGVPNDSKKEDK